MSTLLPAKRRAEKFAALVDATSSTGADEPYAPLLRGRGHPARRGRRGAGSPRRLRRRPALAADGRGRHRAGPAPTPAWCCRSGTRTSRKQQPVHRRRCRSGAGRVGRRPRRSRPRAACRATASTRSSAAWSTSVRAQPLRRRPRPRPARPGHHPAERGRHAARARRLRRRRWPRRCAASPAARVTAPTSCSAPTSATATTATSRTSATSRAPRWACSRTCPPRTELAPARLRRGRPAAVRPRPAGHGALRRLRSAWPARRCPPGCDRSRPSPRSWTCSAATPPQPARRRRAVRAPADERRRRRDAAAPRSAPPTRAAITLPRLDDLLGADAPRSSGEHVHLGRHRVGPVDRRRRASDETLPTPTRPPPACRTSTT